MIEMVLDFSNEATALGAWFVGSLSLFSFYRFHRMARGEPVASLTYGVQVILVGVLARLTYYDVWRTLAVYFDFIRPSGQLATAQIANTGFNLVIIYGCWVLLGAIVQLIPENERPGWSRLTAPFYGLWR